MRFFNLTLVSLMSLSALACDFAVVSETGNLTGVGFESAGTDGIDPSDSDSSPATSGWGDSYEGADTEGSDSGWGDSGVEPGTTTVGFETGGFDPDPEPIPCEGEPVAIDAASLAYTWAQIPPVDYGDTGFGDIVPIDPDTLYVRLSSQAGSCDAPNSYPGCGNWSVTISIPPAFQVPGLYHLSGPDVQGWWEQSWGDEGEELCAGGGSNLDASFEIISVDEQGIKGRICHVEPAFFFGPIDIEGSFNAARCE
jgi:hypothetical protein